MAINIDKINAALDRLDPEKKQSAAGAGSEHMVKLPEGTSTIRLVPYKFDLEMPFREFHFHYGIGGKTFLCPNRMRQEPCEICEVATKMWRQFESTQDETYKDAFKKLVSTSRVYIPIVVRGEEDKGIRWWAVNPRTIYKDVLTIIKNAAKQNIDLTDPTEGRDLDVVVQKGFNDYLIPKSIQVAFAPSKLADTKKATDNILESVVNIDELQTFRENSEQRVALNGFFAGGDTTAVENSVGSVKTFGKEPEESDLIDFGSSKDDVETSVSKKFDRVVNN